MLNKIYIILTIIILYYLFYYKRELFSTKKSDLNNCIKCSTKNRYQCSFCRNCVYCIKEDNCRFGNINGPINKNKKWEFKNDWSNY